MGCNLGHVNMPDDFVPIEVIAGTNHTCALSEDMTVVCWGSNYYGECGVGDCSSPYDAIGDEHWEMGDNLVAVDAGDNFYIEQVKCSEGFTCVLGYDTDVNLGAVRCFGLNNQGQLGYGDAENRGCDSDDLGDNLPDVDLGTDYNVTELPKGP